jgi:hypothetical protein
MRGAVRSTIFRRPPDLAIGAVSVPATKLDPMTDLPTTPDSSAPVPPLAERLRRRLNAAGVAFDRRHVASRPKARRRATSDAEAHASPTEADLLHRRERACLRDVFLELGDVHRRYRARTGLAGTPALRAAAQAFKLDPTPGSLIPVVAQLDELHLLTW